MCFLVLEKYECLTACLSMISARPIIGLCRGAHKTPAQMRCLPARMCLQRRASRDIVVRIALAMVVPDGG